MSKWQPIEQAKGDAPRVLYFPPVPSRKNGRGGMSELYKVDTGVGGPFRFATHFQPLTPPKPEQV